LVPHRKPRITTRSSSLARALPRLSLPLALCALLLSACQLGGTTPPPAPTNTPLTAAQQDFPTVDPNYIYDQLGSLVTPNLRREAGYDTNLPPDQNGHDEFAAAWTAEITKQLGGFGPSVRRDEFPIGGWRGRPAQVNAFNVEVTVPGVTHPEQIVVIGCHYDGMAFSSQSANDDASGCAIELGVAKALAEYWRAHHVYPARTLKFVIFDAEEQGLYGSFHYVNQTINGELGQIVAMINEEQSGIAYPLRFLGKTTNPLLPEYVDVSPLGNSDLYPTQSKLSQTQKDAIAHFRAQMRQSLTPVFQQFQAQGDSSLAYHGASGDETQAIFDDTSHVLVEDDTLGGSDQIPFTLAGLPCATLAGNSTYYDRNPPPWSYPFDQPQDTIQLMNVYASGKADKAKALTLSLALPGMLTTWMLHQSDVLGEVPADGKPLAAISDVGQTVAGQSLALDAHAAYLPVAATPSATPSSSPALTYAWTFGDGGSAQGVEVQHTYGAPGAYTLTLTVSSATAGSRTVSVPLTVAGAAPQFSNPYAGFQSNGRPPSNPAVTIPTPAP
jgi:hypothetical protein